VHRLRQEAANLWMLTRPPVSGRLPQVDLPVPPNPAPVLARLRGTPYASGLVGLADQILQRRVRLFERNFGLAFPIEWRRDTLHGTASGLTYFRRIPYLDTEKVGDHKIVWELNRHQHLVLLAQAFRLSGREVFLEEIQRQLRDWTKANRFLMGINWASALEVAFRALSWIWVYRLCGPYLPDGFLREWSTGIYRHGRFLESNLSVYFSPNTHLLGEAVALHALGAAFPDFPEATRWRKTGQRIVAEEMGRQVLEDGSHFEKSSYYHVYALDFFLFHYLLADCGEGYRAKLLLMADYLDALMGADRSLPLLGDDDGGRVFHPHGRRDTFGRATLATCAVLLDPSRWRWDAGDLCEQAAWWIGESAFAHVPPGAVPPRSRLFVDAGIAIMEATGIQVVADAGAFGFGRGGHSHSDALSVVVRAGRERILEESGTYTYASNSPERDLFRGSAAHNTIGIDGLDQALPAGLFGWRDKPAVEISQWNSESEWDYLDARCSYSGFIHRRRILFVKSGYLFILDTVAGSGGEHLVEQFWHPGEPCIQVASACFSIGTQCHLVLDGTTQVSEEHGGKLGWISPHLWTKHEATAIRASARCLIPAVLGAAILLRSTSRIPALIRRTTDAATEFLLQADDSLLVRFTAAGPSFRSVERDRDELGSAPSGGPDLTKPACSDPYA